MPRRRFAKLRTLLLDGIPALAVRLFLIAVAIAVLALGYRMPNIGATQGEVVLGVVFSLCVGLQVLVAAVYFPMTVKR